MSQAEDFVAKFEQFDGSASELRAIAHYRGAHVEVPRWDGGEVRSWATWPDGSVATWRQPQHGYDLLLRVDVT